jgi:hypothetical protein
MSFSLIDLNSPTGGAYLTPEDQQRALLIAGTLPQRFALMRRVESFETELIEDVVNDVWRTMPSMDTLYFDARNRATRDITLVLRYCVLAMVKDDARYLDENLLRWLKAILHSLDLREAADISYRTLAQHLARRLNEAEYALVEPFVQRALQTLAKED